MYWFVVSLLLFLVASMAFNTVILFRFLWRDQESKLRQAVQNISVLLFSLFLVLLLLELFFKLVFAQSDPSGVLAHHNWLNRYWRTNTLGYRDVEWTPEMLQGRTRVMALGDSFTAGVGIEDPADRFSDLLGRKLGENFAVMNVGVSGANTQQEIRYALAYPYKPDIVILSFYLNDIEETARIMGFKQPGLDMSVPFLVNQSYALNFLYWRIQRLRGLELDNGYQSWWDWVSTVYNNERIWDVYKSELLQFYDLAQAGETRLIVVVFPDLLLVEKSRPITGRVVALFEERGVPVLDVADLVSGIPSERLVVSGVDAHPSKFLHALVAEELYPLILNEQQMLTEH